MKETSKSIARLAGHFLSGELKTLTRKQQLSLAASALAQAEAEQESVKAWGMWDSDANSLRCEVYETKFDTGSAFPWLKAVPVLITRLRPASADKRTQAKRKRGKK